jgi:hypothetical protein
MVRCAEPVVCESWCAMLYQWWWIMESYAQPVVVNHVELCWVSGCETLLSQKLISMVYYTESLVLNRFQLCWDNGCESWWGMLIQWFVNHGVLSCTSSGESSWAMLSQWLWNIVSYAELSVCESWCAMLSQWLWISMLCWTRCVEIMVCYSEPVVGNHGVNAVPVVMNHCLLFCASRCEPWRCILRQ